MRRPMSTKKNNIRIVFYFADPILGQRGTLCFVSCEDLTLYIPLQRRQSGMDLMLDQRRRQ